MFDCSCLGHFKTQLHKDYLKENGRGQIASFANYARSRPASVPTHFDKTNTAEPREHAMRLAFVMEISRVHYNQIELDCCLEFGCIFLTNTITQLYDHASLPLQSAQATLHVRFMYLNCTVLTNSTCMTFL